MILQHPTDSYLHSVFFPKYQTPPDAVLSFFENLLCTKATLAYICQYEDLNIYLR